VKRLRVRPWRVLWNATSICYSPCRVTIPHPYPTSVYAWTASGNLPAWKNSLPLMRSCSAISGLR